MELTPFTIRPLPETGPRTFVQLDGFAVWQHFIAVSEGVSLEIKITDRGEPLCIGVTVRDEEGVNSEALRRVPVARLVKEAFAVAAPRSRPRRTASPSPASSGRAPGTEPGSMSALPRMYASRDPAHRSPTSTWHRSPSSTEPRSNGRTHQLRRSPTRCTSPVPPLDGGSQRRAREDCSDLRSAAAGERQADARPHPKAR